MKLLLIVFLILFAGNSAFADTSIVAIAGLYHGSSKNGYDCYLKIDSNGTALFDYGVDHNQAYGEESGTVTQINDSVFRLDLVMTFGQFINLATEDSLYLDSASFAKLGWPVVEIRYASGAKEKFDPKEGDMVPLNKKLARRKNVAIDIGHIDPIFHKTVMFEIVYGSAPDFISGDSHTYTLCIKNGRATTFGKPSEQTGKLLLKKE